MALTVNRRLRAYLPAVRKIAVATAGFSVIAGGMALIVLPGPGLVVIAIGLAILAREFPWAARLVARFKTLVGRILRAACARARKAPMLCR